MTNQEAIERLENLKVKAEIALNNSNTSCEWLKEDVKGTITAFTMAIEALEKQIPKKPIYSDYGYNGFSELLPNCAKCPSCGREIPYGTWNYEDAHHCECGQRIDWSEAQLSE